MRIAIVALLGALSLVACSKDKPADNATTRGGSAQPVTVEEVRAGLLQKGPGVAEAVNGLVITNDAGVITLKGNVENESMHSEIVNGVRSMPNVRGVRDEIQVGKAAAAPGVGTTTTTGATEGAMDGGAKKQKKQ